MKFVRYTQWSRRPRGASPQSHPIGATRGILAHWEGPRLGDFDHGQCAEKVRGIQAFHRDGRGWADIAYNALVCPHGYVFEGRGANVTSAANGDASSNGDWYAVCYLGGVGDGFTAAGKAAFLDAFAWLREHGAAGPQRGGHRDVRATACPGDEIYGWVSALPDNAPQKEWTDMATEKELKKVVREVVAEALQTMPITVHSRDGDKEWTLPQVLRNLERQQDRDRQLLNEIHASLNRKD